MPVQTLEAPDRQQLELVALEPFRLLLHGRGEIVEARPELFSRVRAPASLDHLAGEALVGIGSQRDVGLGDRFRAGLGGRGWRSRVLRECRAGPPQGQHRQCRGKRFDSTTH